MYESRYLVTGFESGFKIGHSGQLLDNSHFNPHISDNEFIEQKLAEEMKINRILGPFERPPFESYQINPLFLRKKSSGGFRMILDLSYPKDFSSVNNNIDIHMKSVKYSIATSYWPS